MSTYCRLLSKEREPTKSLCELEVERYCFPLKKAYILKITAVSIILIKNVAHLPIDVRKSKECLSSVRNSMRYPKQCETKRKRR